MTITAMTERRLRVLTFLSLYRLRKIQVKFRGKIWVRLKSCYLSDLAVIWFQLETLQKVTICTVVMRCLSFFCLCSSILLLQAVFLNSFPAVYSELLKLFDVREVAKMVHDTLGSLPTVMHADDALQDVKLQCIAKTVESELYSNPGKRM